MAAMIALRMSWDVAAGREVHDGVGAELDGVVAVFRAQPSMFEVVEELPILALILQLRSDADRHRLEVRVVDVGRDDHPAARDFIADQRGRGAPGERRIPSPR